MTSRERRKAWDELGKHGRVALERIASLNEVVKCEGCDTRLPRRRLPLGRCFNCTFDRLRAEGDI